MWGFGYFTLCCPFWSAVQEQVSPPVNFFLVALWTTVMTQSFQPTPASGPIALFCSVLINVFQVVFLLWELLSFPRFLQFLLRLYVPLTKSGSFVNTAVVYTADKDVEALVLFQHCLALALFFNHRAKHRTWVCVCVLDSRHSVLPQLCQLLPCVLMYSPPCAAAAPHCFTSEEPGVRFSWSLTYALKIKFKPKTMVEQAGGTAAALLCSSFMSFSIFMSFLLFFSWVSLDTRVGNCQLGERKETTLKYLSHRPLLKQYPVRTSVPPGCLQSAVRNWKFLWLLLTGSCVLGAHSAPSWGVKSTFR